jgi:hypothetical protein
MGHPETPPDNGDDIPQIIRRLINETLTGSPIGGAVNQTAASEQERIDDPLDECRQRAQEAWQSLYGYLETGQPANHDVSATAGLLLYTLMGDAIARQDGGQVEQYITALDGLTLRRDIKVGIYAKAMQAGYGTAETSLHTALLSEWSGAAVYGSGSPDAVTASPLLRTAVQEFRRNGSDPESLISEYALSPAHALQLRIMQLRQPGEGESRAELEERVAEDFINLSTINTLAVAKQAVEAIANPQLRLRIMERTLAVINDSGQAYSPEMQNLVEKVFGEILWDDPSGGEPTLQHMADIIEANHERSPAPFVDAWELDQRIFAGNTPAQIVAFIDERTTGALSGSGFSFEADIALANRDTLLQRYAPIYAAHGDFDGAQLMLAGIGDRGVYEAALQACIGHSSSVDELQKIRPHSMYDSVDGSTIPSFALAMANYSEDTEKLCAIAMNLARESIDDTSDRKRGQRLAAPTEQLSSFLADSKRDVYLHAAYQMVEWHDPLRSHQLATDILTLLRTHDNPHSDRMVQFLSDALVRDGDSNELRRAYEALPKNTDGHPPLRGVLRLLNLTSTDPIPEWLRAELDFACD